MNSVDTQFVDYSSVREIWKKEIEASEFELQERKEEESEAAKAAAANIRRIDEEKFSHMEEESIVCDKHCILNRKEFYKMAKKNTYCLCIWSL